MVLLLVVLPNFGASSLTPGTNEDFFEEVLKPGGQSSVLLWLSGNLGAYRWGHGRTLQANSN